MRIWSTAYDVILGSMLLSSTVICFELINSFVFCAPSFLPRFFTQIVSKSLRSIFNLLCFSSIQFRSSMKFSLFDLLLHRFWFSSSLWNWICPSSCCVQSLNIEIGFFGKVGGSILKKNLLSLFFVCSASPRVVLITCCDKMIQQLTTRQLPLFHYVWVMYKVLTQGLLTLVSGLNLSA